MNDTAGIDMREGVLRASLRLMRPRQWIKNAFVLAPLFFSRKLLDVEAVTAGIAATAVFCLIASAIYVFNDLRDVASDRQHPTKRTRPIAAGAVSPALAVALMVGLCIAALALMIACALPAKFLILAAIYFAISIAYTLWTKQVPLLELFSVAFGYVLRVLAGCEAAVVEPSPWILSATMVIALLIVFGKRRAEFAEIEDAVALRASLRGYTLDFLDSAISMLGGMAVVFYLLYVLSDYAAARYHNPIGMLATALFVSFGVLRYILLIKSGRGADAPTDLILRDPGILASVALWIATFAMVIYL